MSGLEMTQDRLGLQWSEQEVGCGLLEKDALTGCWVRLATSLWGEDRWDASCLLGLLSNTLHCLLPCRWTPSCAPSCTASTAAARRLQKSSTPPSRQARHALLPCGLASVAMLPARSTHDTCACC